MKELKNYYVQLNEKNAFHAVDPSPWPFFTGISVLNLITWNVNWYIHPNFPNKLNYWGTTEQDLSEVTIKYLTIGSILMVAVSIYCWFKNIIIEGTYEGQHTRRVNRSLSLGFILFIVSEVMFFFSFFWGYFHASLAPAIAIGGIWPPEGIIAIHPFRVPLLNTIILLLSGVTVTFSHHAFLKNLRNEAIAGLVATVLLGGLFTLIQLAEYKEALYSINDGIFGSIFYMLTGFHGFHVIVGTILLIVCYFRLVFNQFFVSSHVGFETAIWYWHFVDVVWLFLYVFVYWWGGSH